MSNIYGRQVVLPLTNKSGGGVVAGDVVVIDTANDGAFTTTTSARSQLSLGVAQETIANNATGRVLVHGYAALVNVPASVTRGHYVETHTVAKQATGNSTRRSGSFGQFLTGGTTPTAWLWGFPDNAGASGETVATSTIWDAKGDLAAATGADAAAKVTVGANGTVLTADSGQSTGVKWGTPFVSYQTVAIPQGLILMDAVPDVFATNATAQIGRASPIMIAGRMRVRSLWIHVTSAAAGSVQWGLFDYSASLTSATKLAGGSAAPGGTGFREIAASGAPIDVPPGQYMLVVMNPASTPSTISTGNSVAGASPGYWKAIATYTWDDTPDFTTGWGDSSLFYVCYLEGDLDASNTRW